MKMNNAVKIVATAGGIAAAIFILLPMVKNFVAKQSSGGSSDSSMYG